MVFRVKDLEKEMDRNPYDHGVTLIAHRIGDLYNEPRSYDGSNINDQFVSHAEEIWRAAQQVLLWWTPARVEEEALRRANDEVEPSIIAREHHLLLGVFLHWQGLLLRWAPHAAKSSHPTEQDCVRRAIFTRDAIVQALEILERKGAAAEARAMDIRLRIDHQKIAQLVAGHELVSRLQQIVDLQRDNTSGIEHLRRTVADLAGPIVNAERLMGSLENAADFACEKLVQGPPQQRSRVKVAVALLVNAAASSGTKVFLEHLLRLLG
jgi:hypothetical protein